MLSPAWTILHYGKKIMRYKFVYFVVFIVLLVHVSDSFSARLEKPEVRTETARMEAMEPMDKMGADKASVVADPDNELEKSILGADIVTFAMSLKGKPYTWAGVKPSTGFDCSGFIYFVYGEYGISLPHSSRAQYKEGTEISESEARKGDLVFFRGTNPKSKAVGHVGIVTSEPGEPVRFVHSSTGRGVVEDGIVRSYRRRYIGIKRIL
ncbi:C40 family peptidase [Roseivirga sp. BDSF3-8]|uniref:C40 family peptidase n=1 Tax=Roseivirga sp. BDSF3-8 TaxID=3241598 RepID=UPI003532650B